MNHCTVITDPDQISRVFQVFFDYVRVLVDIPKSDREYCRQLFEPVFVRKNTIL